MSGPKHLKPKGTKVADLRKLPIDEVLPDIPHIAKALGVSEDEAWKVLGQKSNICCIGGDV